MIHVLIAPSGSDKTALVKALASRNDPEAEKVFVTASSGLKVRILDGDRIREVAGVYRSLKQQFGPMWWKTPEHAPVKEKLMRRAFGLVIKSGSGLPQIVLTAERVPVFMHVACSVVVIPAEKRYEYQQTRNTGQPKDSLEEIRKENLYYESLAAAAGVTCYSSDDAALRGIMGGEWKPVDDCQYVTSGKAGVI